LKTHRHTAMLGGSLKTSKASFSKTL